MSVSGSGISGDREFPATAWSVIVHARDPASPDYERHLGRLVQLYWRPVYCVVRPALARLRQRVLEGLHAAAYDVLGPVEHGRRPLHPGLLPPPAQ